MSNVTSFLLIRKVANGKTRVFEQILDAVKACGFKDGKAFGIALQVYKRRTIGGCAEYVTLNNSLSLRWHNKRWRTDMPYALDKTELSKIKDSTIKRNLEMYNKAKDQLKKENSIDQSR